VRNSSGVALFSTLLATLAATGFAASPIEYANPLVGTDGHGHAFPGTTTPFGMVQLSPDTRTGTWDGSSGYHYSDSTILGFSHTHLAGTGVGCLGDIMLMPTVGEPTVKEDEYKSPFTHKKEIAKPGYYKVFLDKPGVTAELTATPRTGFHRSTFPASSQSHLVLDLTHGISNNSTETHVDVVSNKEIVGYRKSSGWGGNRTLYFAMTLSKPFRTIGLDLNGLPVKALEATGQIKARLDFRTYEGEAIEVRVGISAVSVEGARKNLAYESNTHGFADVRASASAMWSEALGRITVQSPNKADLRTFYSNAYLSYLAPNLFCDADATYVGLDHKVHAPEGFQNYSTFSLWDTYRALHPLLTITQPERVPDLTRSLIAEYEQGPYRTTPVWPLAENETWCMIGYHSVPVLVDAYFKGLLGAEAERVYSAIRTSAMRDTEDLRYYRNLGYVASRGGAEATSKTIEFAVDDWAIARMAAAMGKRQDADLFFRRATNYRNLFDRTTRFFRGRKAGGNWRTPFDTLGHVGDEYTEACAWQYGFAVQQDVPGMIGLYGGDKAFVARMDEMFTMDSRIHTGIPDITGLVGQYAQGNEQCHHQAYLYDYAGAPWKTQSRVRDLMKRFYNDRPDGQIGNNDCGQMSAWYIFSAVGFYPVNPASGDYVIGSPLVDSAVISLPGGKRFSVIAQNNSSKNVYIQKAFLNGKPYSRVWLSHDDIVRGGSLKLVMGSQPNVAWGAAVKDRPRPTMPTGYKYGPLPEPSTSKVIVLPLPIRVAAGEDDPIGNFVGDPNMNEGSTNRTGGRVDVSDPLAGPERMYLSERYGQDYTFRYPVPAAGRYTVRLHFAEVFNDAPGQRLENISINGQRVLTNFDPVVAAGGPRKAVVRSFTGISADAKGVISIRIQAAPGSPDQNAKISGIEIIAE
jgi:predicted alpha-1,2-mannosidase